MYKCCMLRSQYLQSRRGIINPIKALPSRARVKYFFKLLAVEFLTLLVDRELEKSLTIF